MPLFSSAPVVTVLRLQGIIGSLGPFRRGLTLRAMAGQIERAFRPKRLVAVALVVNSPGGSPVQSALIFRRIRHLARKRDVPVLTFIEDVAASGGYWLACAGDEIYADENSIVGSIGVLSASFGFAEAIKRLGIERRVHTAGEHKAALDPFLPEDPHDVTRIKAIQADVHDSFKSLVRSRRGRKLRAAEEQLFNGDFWTGRRGVDLGLVDGLADLRGVITDRFGDKVRIVPMGERASWLRRRLGVRGGEAPESRVPDLGAGFAGGLLAAVEERFLWSRFGL
ncbi:MAG: S49 family peptidase [Rhodospirillaceae bacterium]|nr:S49 family peptidase [Rhodospirillaceae bacterium]